MLIKTKSIKEHRHFIKLWVHEISRVFKDRLISEEDKKLLMNNITTALKKRF